MASQKWIVCRLCLKIQDNVDEFKAIEDDMKDILDKVLQNMDFASVQNPVMCTNCADTLLKCFDFKAKCNSDYIAPYMNKQDDVKLNLIDVYSKCENGTGVLEVRDVCGLCRSPLKNSSVLTVVIEGDVALTKMIEQCVPEVDRNSIKKSVICLQCQGSLENCFRFLTDCLMVEDKIKKYCERLDIDSNGGMDQSRLLQLATMNFTGEVDGSSTDLIKVKDEFCEGIENADETGIANGSDVFEFNQVFCNDREEKIDLKRESFMDVDELKFGNEECFTSKNVVKLEEPFFGENGFREEKLVELKDQKFLLDEEVEIKTDESDFNRVEPYKGQTNSIGIRISEILKSNMEEKMMSDIKPSTGINRKEEALLVPQKTKEKSKKTPMTNAEKCRNYRQRKKLQVNAEKKEKSKNSKIKSCTSNAERCRNYRQRKQISRTNLLTTINGTAEVNDIVIVEKTPSKNALNIRRYRQKKARLQAKAIKSRISNAERCRNYRQRRKISQTNSLTTVNDTTKADDVVMVENTRSKGALASQRYRQKKGQLQAKASSGTNASNSGVTNDTNKANSGTITSNFLLNILSNNASSVTYPKLVENKNKSQSQNKRGKNRKLNISEYKDERNVLVKKRKPNDLNVKEEALLITQKEKEKPKYSQVKSCISNAERCRNYRQRKKISRTNLLITVNDAAKADDVVIVENTRSKGALASQRYRQKKAQLQAKASSASTTA